MRFKKVPRQQTCIADTMQAGRLSRLASAIAFGCCQSTYCIGHIRSQNGYLQAVRFYDEFLALPRETEEDKLCRQAFKADL